MADTTFPTLPLAIPPQFEEALGYDGQTRLIAFYQAAGQAYYSDGRAPSVCEQEAFRYFVRHPAIAPMLHECGFRSASWLVLDRECGTLAVVPAVEAQLLLQQQWKPAKPESIEIEVTASVAWTQLVAEMQQRIMALPPTIIQAHRRRQQAVMDELAAWLNERETWHR